MSTATEPPRRTSRWRWLLPALLLIAWLVAAGGGGPFAGKLSEVASNDASTFLPASAESTRADELYALRNRDQIAPGTQNVGTIEAISVETGRTVWKREQRAGQTSLLATASGLLFGGDTNGRFRAYEQRTGEILWEVNLGSHVTGFPAAFAVNGRQYIAVSTGGTPNTFGLAQLTPDLRAGTANNLYVFALP